MTACGHSSYERFVGLRTVDRLVERARGGLAIRVDSEADAELLAKYGVRDGKMFVLVEGS